MSVRSYICIENDNKTYTGIYCHENGEPMNNGLTLALYYKNREKVKELISFGDMSALFKNIHPNKQYPHSFNFFDRQPDVCVFYGRDRREKNVAAKEVNLKQINDEGLIDYCYVYGLDDYWYYFSVGEFDEFKLIKLDYEQLVKILNEEDEE